MSTPALQCTRHYAACDCREHKIAVLAKAASDAAFELDEVKLLANICADEKARLLAVVERVNAACDALGVVLFADVQADDIFCAEEGGHP